MVSAIKNGIVPLKGTQGIVKLSEAEAKRTGYTHKLKILGKGGDIRLYGTQDKQGHIIFDTAQRHWWARSSMKLEKNHLEILYAKANTSFDECAARQGAQILSETGVDFETITAKPDSVCIRFFEMDGDSYIIETKLLLFSEASEPLGWYCLHLDQNHDVVDDFLVFN